MFGRVPATRDGLNSLLEEPLPEMLRCPRPICVPIPFPFLSAYEVFLLTSGRFEVSQQQANIAIGTAFAFLAKASLVFAISVAFVQLFWHAVSARRREFAPTVERVDALHSTLENAFEMFNFKSWWSHPLLMLVAGLTWYVGRICSRKIHLY